MVNTPRPDALERRVARKARIDSRKPVYTVPKQWTFKAAKEICERVGFSVHENAQAEWDKQTCNPSIRKVWMNCGKKPTLNSVLSGASSGVKRTAEQQADTNALISATRKARNYGHNHWLEVSAWSAFFDMFEKYFPEQLEVQPLPDGLGADLIVRYKGSEKWAAVQVKSAMDHPGEQMNLRLKKIDGADGEKYEHMPILALGVQPGSTRPLPEEGFNAVTKVKLTDIFVFRNASEMPGKTLQPVPRQLGSGLSDAFGNNRFSSAVNTEEDLHAILQLALKYFTEEAKFTREQAWFGRELNTSVSKNHWQEVKNCEALAQLVGFENLSAPFAQGETVDTIWTFDHVQARISLKTVSKHSNGFGFDTKKAPNSAFCNVVLAFYYDKDTAERTHVSVICGRRVYDHGYSKFFWSLTSREDVMEDSIDLRTPDALHKLKSSVIALL